jgi:hypothetical protein
LKLGDVTVRTSGAADLVAYVGHNGLMDFTVEGTAITRGNQGKPVIILACRSKSYFTPWLTALGAQGLLLTTGLMAPEAYTLDALLNSWLSGGRGIALRDAAANAYSQYQKCGLRPAQRLFHTTPEPRPEAH